MSEEEKSKRIKFIIEIKDSILFLDEENSRYVIEEIERLRAELKLEEDNRKYLNEQIERLHSIIKEAREYIQDRYDGEVLTHTFDKDNVGELLEILGSDKE